MAEERYLKCKVCGKKTEVGMKAKSVMCEDCTAKWLNKVNREKPKANG